MLGYIFGQVHDIKKKKEKNEKLSQPWIDNARIHGVS